jgi:hypothetical protein
MLKNSSLAELRILTRSATGGARFLARCERHVKGARLQKQAAATNSTATTDLGHAFSPASSGAASGAATNCNPKKKGRR